MIIRAALLSLFCFSFCNLTGAETQKNQTESIASIDEEIRQLKIKQARCNLARKEASDKADRFLNSNDWLSNRRQVAIEIEMENQIEEIKEKIAVLEQKKKQLEG
jgi:hypothetical protein